MNLFHRPIFTWPIDWADSVNGSWDFDLRELQMGFGPVLRDVQQSHVIHGFEFTVDLQGDSIDDIESFLSGLEGRSRNFWMPGPEASFKIDTADTLASFKIAEQGAATSWQLHPGGYLYFTKLGEQSQVAQITGITDNGDGTETVTFSQVLSTQNSSSSSANSSSSGSSSSSSSQSTSSSSQSSQSSSSSSRSRSSSSSSSSTENESSSSSEGQVTTSSSSAESSSSSQFLAIDETWQCFPLYLVRLADDVERVSIVAERWQRRTLRVVEVPSEYTTAPADEAKEPAAPIFLYRFTAELPDGPIVWRFTSHPTDVTLEDVSAQSSSSSSSTDSASSSSSSSKSSVAGSSSSSSSTRVSVTSSSSSSSRSSASDNSSSSSSESESSSSSPSGSSSSSSSSSSESRSSSSSSTTANSSSSSSGPVSTTWLAVPIEHGRISRSTKGGGSTTIVGDYDTIEPLRLLIPLRLSVPLLVEILKTSRDLDEPETLLNATVTGPQLEGRKVTVRCNEWGAVMSQSIPGFYIQRDCNYRVYEAHTCRADRASKETAVTVTAKAGRLISVSGAGLAGKAADYFAFGWMEVGTGLNRRTYFILTSSTPFGTGMTLTLSSEMDLELPITATLVAGCDGMRATCLAKFDNLVNFGGHAPPKENLTLVAMKAPTAAVAKK